MNATSTEQPSDAVEAELLYLAPDSTLNRRFVAPGIDVNTGRFEPHRVLIRNGRPVQHQFTLDTHGFTLAPHRSRVPDFTDKAAVDALYPGELIEIVKTLTGADLVVPLGAIVRTADASAGGATQPPASDAHVDFTPTRAVRYAEQVYRKHSPGGPGFRRFIASSCWRAFSDPPQDWPLAVCEARSVAPEEGTPNVMVVVDALPSREAMYGPLAGEDTMPAASVFHFNPNHRWWYFPNMTRDEILLLKFYDSDQSRAWRTPHTAFHDPTFPDARTRRSIEFRSFAFFL
ncbi:MAG TPA: CmcJ/NvfI family oxidoreductase [Bryobacteraceae bacterium]|nr:CmcJ/NvfI family oxidoreductase [Bryobacteraceae bacterium]